MIAGHYATVLIANQKFPKGTVNAKLKCHRLRKPEMSPLALAAARLSSPETSCIAGLRSLAD
ncbi:MAG: hypothetical protein ACI84R_001853 [Candidatus Azotimanducaceae bacterium]|jgi:hypothetical protein